MDEVIIADIKDQAMECKQRKRIFKFQRVFFYQEEHNQLSSYVQDETMMSMIGRILLMELWKAQLR